MDFVSVPDQPSRPPELTTDHTYTQASCAPMFDQVQRCLPAVKLLEAHENELHSSGVCGSGRRFLTRLEKCMLDFVMSGACQGVLYAAFFGHGCHILGRIIESGCLQRVSDDGDINRVIGEMFPDQEILRYRIFSEEDFFTLGSRKRKRPGARQHIGQTYKRCISKLEEPLKCLKAVSSAGSCLRGCVLLLLRKNAKANKPHHSFFQAFGDSDKDWQALEAVLQSFQVCGGLPQPGVQLADLNDGSALQEQLDAISTIGNTSAGIPRVVGQTTLNSRTRWCYPYSLITCKKISDGKYLPLSLRNRLLHFLLENDISEITKLLPCLRKKNSLIDPPHEASSLQADGSCSQSKTVTTGPPTSWEQAIIAGQIEQELEIEVGTTALPKKGSEPVASSSLSSHSEKGSQMSAQDSVSCVFMEMASQRKVFDIRRWLCLSRSEYITSCGISSVVSCWNYLFSRLGHGSLSPITEEQALEILGFRPPFEEIQFGPFTANITLLRWFRQLNKHFQVKGHCCYMYNPQGKNMTSGLTSGDALIKLKQGLQETNSAYIYHCQNHYFCPIGYEDVPLSCIQANSSALPQNELDTWVLIGDTSQRDPSIHCKRWEDIYTDLKCPSPQYLDIHCTWKGKCHTKKVGGNLHCILALKRATPASTPINRTLIPRSSNLLFHRPAGSGSSRSDMEVKTRTLESLTDKESIFEAGSFDTEEDLNSLS